MRKFISIILALLLSISVCACSSETITTETDPPPSISESESEASTPSPTPTPTPEPTPEPEPASRIGESVFLGTYEQDNNLENGPEPIEWVIISEDETSYQLASKYVLDFKNFHNEEEIIDWETSDIRAWLNGDFYSNNFTDAEKTQILLTKVDNSIELVVAQEEKIFFNPLIYGHHQGGDTEDYVYLFSEDELRSLIMAEFYRLIEEKIFYDLDRIESSVPRSNVYATAYAYQVGIDCNRRNNQIDPENGMCAILTRSLPDPAVCREHKMSGEKDVFVLDHYISIKIYDHWRQPFGILPVINISK